MIDYSLETLQERRNRRHEEDKIINPDRHNPQKDRYTLEESMEFCSMCAPNFRDNYEYYQLTHELIKKRCQNDNTASNNESI
jgi:hypothetical protein